MNQLSQQILNLTDSSFKYILILFNFMTLIVVYLHKNKQKRTKQHHVLFVTAHPDDQVMFFRPSITSINKDYFVHLLCLSGGQTQRQNELKRSVQNLKIHKLECLNNQRLKNSINQPWPKQQIQSIVQKYVQQNNIKAIFTFDKYGVSNHLNHRSISEALEKLHYSTEELNKLTKQSKSLTQQQKARIQQIKNETIKIYHLKSVNLIRKYTGFFEIVFALIRDYSWVNLNLFQAYKAMAIHKSQFVWYRKLWVFFSQYSYINIYSMTRMKVNPVKANGIQIKETQKSEKIQIQGKQTNQTKKQN